MFENEEDKTNAWNQEHVFEHTMISLHCHDDKSRFASCCECALYALPKPRPTLCCVHLSLILECISGADPMLFLAECLLKGSKSPGLFGFHCAKTRAFYGETSR